jgi:hypothetical protein
MVNKGKATNDVARKLGSQLIWSVRGGEFSGDEELAFCGMLRNGSRHSPKNTSHTPVHSRR